MQKVSRKLLFMATLLLVAAFVNVQAVSANNGAIWTVTGSCGSPQNVNHYVSGDPVFINGENFDPGDYDWEIKGQPGQASNHPNQVVASGVFTVGETGSFCFEAYTIGAEDGGTYQVNFGNKNDNYRVQQVQTTPTPFPTPDPPGNPTPDPTPVPTQDPTPEDESAPVLAQSTPAPVVAPTTGANSGPAALIVSAASAIGLSGLSLGAWLKRRKM